MFETSSEEEDQAQDDIDNDVLVYDDDYEELQSYGPLKYPIYYTIITFSLIKEYTWGLCCRKKQS